MYTWFRYVPSVLTLTGKLTEANTLLTAWISEKIVVRARRRSAAPALPELTSKYLPLLTLAMLLSSAVQPGPWPVRDLVDVDRVGGDAVRLCFMKRAHSSADVGLRAAGRDRNRGRASPTRGRSSCR